MSDVLERIRLFVKALMFEKRMYTFQIKSRVSLSDLGKCAKVLSRMNFRTDREPNISVGPRASRILVIAPHPDDEMIGAGGTLIKAIRRGAEVRVLYLTSGKKDTAKELEEETLAVSNRVGYSVDFLHQPLKKISLDKDLVSEVAGLIEDFSPDSLFVPLLLDDHDDHRRASHVVLKVFSSGKISRNVDVWAYQVYSTLKGNVIVDISDVREEKAGCIAMWSSQMLIRDWVHYSLGMNAYNCRFLKEMADEAYLEVFVVLPLSEYVALCSVYFENDGAEAYYTPWYREKSKRQ